MFRQNIVNENGLRTIVSYLKKEKKMLQSEFLLFEWSRGIVVTLKTLEVQLY